MALGYTLIGLAQGHGLAAVGLMFMGFSVGAHATMSAVLWAEFYGTQNLGRIRAMTGAIMVVGTAIGPALSGWLIDFGIDLPTQSFGISVYFLLAAALGATGARKAAHAL